MSHIFISHVERDAAIMQQIADGLEAAGYSTWYFERDTLPGASYIIQILEALAQCRAVALIISPRSVGSDRVTKEVVHGFETGNPFFRVMYEMSHQKFQQHQPEWRYALAASLYI